MPDAEPMGGRWVVGRWGEPEYEPSSGLHWGSPAQVGAVGPLDGQRRCLRLGCRVYNPSDARFCRRCGDELGVQGVRRGTVSEARYCAGPNAFIRRWSPRDRTAAGRPTDAATAPDRLGRAVGRGFGAATESVAGGVGALLGLAVAAFWTCVILRCGCLLWP